jgi:tRNA dimethylallyltransferase
MGTDQQQAPLVVIVGPTASGKSGLALDIAERYNGEIICADSRTVYKGMDIGTAKPSLEDQSRVPHHLLDVVLPNQKFNVAEFKKLANQAIIDIYNRGKLPVLVGGTGLYVDAILYDFGFSSKDAEKDPVNPRHLKDPNQQANARELRNNTVVIGLKVPPDILKERIENRVQSMLDAGLEAEVNELAQIYGWQAEAMTGVGYREWQPYFEGKQTQNETEQRISTHTNQYAKRQRTWFKRNPHIQWINSMDIAQQIVMSFLQQNK